MNKDNIKEYILCFIIGGMIIITLSGFMDYYMICEPYYPDSIYYKVQGHSPCCWWEFNYSWGYYEYHTIC